ncbi:MAG: DUF485 domain-containing protein [Methylophilales bacterium]|nr:DUF485 domain-containing protein [Methylophilales bacterium]
MIKRKRNITISLLTLTIITYFGFISIINFKPSYFGIQNFNSNVSIGIVLGLLLIILIWVITLLYVYLTNKYIHPILQKINDK